MLSCIWLYPSLSLAHPSCLTQWRGIRHGLWPIGLSQEPELQGQGGVMLKARPSSVNFRAHRAPWREHLQQTKIARGGAVRQSSAPSLNLCLFHMCFCLNLSCIPLIADTFYMPFLSVDRPKTGTARAVHATLYPGLSLVRCQARKHIPEYCISVLFHSRLGTTKTKAEFAMNVQ